MMIATSVVDEIRRLLQEGCLSQRKIAAQIGVSRGTVNAIALGRRAEPLDRRQAGDDLHLVAELPPGELAAERCADLQRAAGDGIGHAQQLLRQCSIQGLSGDLRGLGPG